MLFGSLRCAVIDDDPEDCRLVARYVNRASEGRWSSTALNSYSDGERALSDGVFDIAFVDLRLGNRTGLDLIRSVDGREGSPPIVMISGHADDAVQESAISAGAYDFIPKDELNARTLKRAVHHACSAHATEQALRRSANSARDANDAKSSFLACMSHDLRTPLNAIIGFSDVLLQGTLGPVDEKLAKEYAGYINESGRHLLEIINTILDLSKIEQRKFSLNREWLDLEEVITAQTRLLRSIAADRSVQLLLHFNHEGRLLLADRRAFQQIFNNVMSNAIKFSESGGAVTVSTSLDSDGLDVRIADTGKGMSGPELRLALTPFGQACSDAQLARKGTGLGLTIVQALMQEHGGAMHVDTRKGAGTSVRLAFPAGSVSRER